MYLCDQDDSDAAAAGDAGHPAVPNALPAGGASERVAAAGAHAPRASRLPPHRVPTQSVGPSAA